MSCPPDTAANQIVWGGRIGRMASEFIVSAGEVFDGLSAGNGQPNQTIYVLPGGFLPAPPPAAQPSSAEVRTLSPMAARRSGTTVLAGGEEIVASSGFASGTVVSSGGTLVVPQGGLDENPDAGFGVGGEYLSAATTVSSGGEEIVLGYSSAVMIDSGGLVVVSSGAMAAASQVNSGGVEVISSGGVAGGAFVSSGGEVVVVERRNHDR
jgi:autotransporter passenger strand-loop-strand repeat protein